MRQSFLSLVPMMSAAILVMVGGIRMAQVTHETRTPLDRDRILDFDAKFRDEIERLNALYAWHLKNIAINGLYPPEGLSSHSLPNVPGVLQLQLIHKPNKVETITAVGMNIKLPELDIEGGKQPLNPNFSSAIDSAFLQKLPEARWLETPAPGIRIYLAQPRKGILAVIFIDERKVLKATNEYLEEWLKAPLTPLTESGERSCITSSTGLVLATTGPKRHGPAAISLPIRADIGSWQIDGWDGIATSTHHDLKTLVTAATLSILLTLAGVFIFIQQRRATRLASERVSFVNRVSHELSTPLTNIALNLDLARDHLVDPPPTARKRLDHVNEEIQRLSRLVANVLTFSRRERDTIVIRPQACTPDKVISETLDSFKPALARRQIEVECQLGATNTSWTDPDALAQITGNLISNVEKYAAAGKWIRIETRQKNGRLTMMVHDHGPGIPAAFRNDVFNAFGRVHRGTNEGSSGTGLGLTIARELACQMGGTLELIESSKGCTFRLIVPTPLSPHDTNAEQP